MSRIVAGRFDRTLDAEAVLAALRARDVGRAEGDWRDGSWRDFDPRAPLATV